MKEALFYKKLDGKKVRCNLCPHHCLISDGKRGICGVRQNTDGVLYSLIYGKLCAVGVDPIEKKPLFHFLPGSSSYSIASIGCNMLCKFCQNWQISQAPKPAKIVSGREVSPKDVVEEAISSGCKSISYTYTEPTIFLEFALDTAKLARKRGLKNILVSNGFTSPDAIREAAKIIDAVNIDLKGFSDEFYLKVCGARLQPILDAIKLYYELGVWVEITTLIVPGQNDSDEMLEKMATFIAKIDKTIPWHISRFHPDYKMLDVGETGLEVIHKAIEIGKKAGIKYIYSGNVIADTNESTFCPDCGKKVISRFGYYISTENLVGKNCRFCNYQLRLII